MYMYVSQETKIFSQKWWGCRDEKAQKQDIIQNGRIFGIPYPFLHSTQYCSHIMDSLLNVGMGIEFQIFFHSE